MVFRLIICLALVSFGYGVRGQDTLPHFSVINRNGKVILSWVNNFPLIKQLSIQRSPDSLKGFKTILTLPDPTSVTNGFLDNNAPNDSSYYKLYILLDKGAYIFSKSQKPHKYIPPPIVKTPQPPIQKEESFSHPLETAAKANPNATQPEDNGDSPEAATKTYQPASAATTADKKRSDGLKPVNINLSRPATFRPSGFVFTNADGDITIVLPPDRLENFKIRFYEANGEPLFEINQVKASLFTLDKSNFLHAGWFSFELFEGGQLKEKNKIKIP